MYARSFCKRRDVGNILVILASSNPYIIRIINLLSICWDVCCVCLWQLTLDYIGHRYESNERSVHEHWSTYPRAAGMGKLFWSYTQRSNHDNGHRLSLGCWDTRRLSNAHNDLVQHVYEGLTLMYRWVFILSEELPWAWTALQRQSHLDKH